MSDNTQTRTCPACKKPQPLSYYRKRTPNADNIKRNRVGRLYGRCIECDRTHLDNDPHGLMSELLRGALSRCKHPGSTLTHSELVDLYSYQRAKCALTGITMTARRGKGHVHTNISIDRIDSSKPYTLANVQLVCAIVNRMKSVMSHSELILWCQRILAHAKK